MGERELGPRPVVVAGKEGGGREAGRGQGEGWRVGVIEVGITVDRHAVAEGQVGTESHTRIMRHADPAIIRGMPSSLYAVPPALTAAAALLLGASILIRSRGSRPAVLFFAVTAIVRAWLIGFAILFRMSDPRAALDWARVATLPVAFIPPVPYPFATVETGGDR